MLISTADHVAGKPHGFVRRYFANGELADEASYQDGIRHGEHRYVRPSDPAIAVTGQLGRLPARIARHVCVYEHGDLVGQRYFDAGDVELTSNGAPMPPRPPGVPPTAFTIDHQGWFWSRRRDDQRLESREYFPEGALRRECDDRTGAERSYYAGGGLRVEGARNIVGEGRYLVGDWRHYDREGQLYHVATYDRDRASHRKVRERWYREGGTRQGAIDRGVEVGVWELRTGDAVLELALGDRCSDAELLDHAVCADELVELAFEPRDRSLPAMLARARRAGIAGDPSLLEAVCPRHGPAWHDLDDEGNRIPLAHHPSSNLLLVELVQALRWEPPTRSRLVAIAEVLFQQDRTAAALDVLDAALAVEPDDELRRTRAAYLRALGRFDEAEQAVARPERLDPRARDLLAEIRAHPDDDAPRLVFADHVADRFPAHAALIVAQCQGRPATALTTAFHATLPAWLRAEPRRGFLDDLWAFEAEQFVTVDPDLLHRVCPTLQRVSLAYASRHIATLVTLPSLRHCRDLAFTETYLDPTTVAQLAACPYLDDLTDLGLASTGLGDEELRVLAGATAFPRLESLDLGYGREDQDYTPAGVRALLQAPFAGTLAHLILRGRRLGDEIVDVLAQLPALTSLDLGRTGLTDLAALELATFTRERELVSLDVSHNDFSAAAKRALAMVYGERVTL